MEPLQESSLPFPLPMATGQPVVRRVTPPHSSTWPIVEQASIGPSKKNGVPDFQILQVLSHFAPFRVMGVYIFEVDLKNMTVHFSHPTATATSDLHAGRCICTGGPAV